MHERKARNGIGINMDAERGIGKFNYKMQEQETS
jgi:hypothetical protein